ncbi:MAG: GNAT family N-acetyltransferase [Reyranella sp.]|uniref:GNAT family N-acetyltransferase n=1 Tax=Reyranella sp. TaxID=1929291 RepID=UPI001AC178D1|nr:GNAT family N-acetyltransferase [Reyranella sp.]MBN9088152.1 GNAT family N-acetyltransferase [Reyranella sp.]
MSIELRSGTAADAAACGTICYEAFKSVNSAHNFPPDFASAEEGRELMAMLLSHPGHHSVVAELDGRIVGSDFMDERAPIYGIGPITVDPAMQNRGTGGQLMRHMLDRAASRQAAGVRLLQTGFHNRSLCFYSLVGFRTREPISILQGAPLNQKIAGHDVRPATPVDLMALIGAATDFGRPGFLVPTRNHEVSTWCLKGGLRLVYQMTLMTVGLYNEPTDAGCRRCCTERTISYLPHHRRPERFSPDALAHKNGETDR